MPVTKYRIKTDLKQSIKTKLSTKSIVTGVISIAVISILTIINTGKPFSSQAKDSGALKIVNLKDQAFTNETELQNTEIKPASIPGKNTLFIKKVKPNIQP